MYMLDVFGVSGNIYKNFRNYCDDIVDMDNALAEFNGKDIPGSKYFEFETEEDAIAFVLRFG
jgi:hypothetical protein